jgi:protocatechuate 3,4-dioxygenase beta subunit
MGIRFSRRRALQALTIGTAGAGLSSATPAFSADAAAEANPQGVCVLFPQAVEGPFYFDPKLLRSDISEGRPGVPLQITLRVIESGACTPIANARVDIWHADAGGLYSGYVGQGAAREVSTKGESFLRGTQMTDADGVVKFRSVYPGWYPGRTPHIHVKVFLDAATLVTGQVYFPDDLSAQVYKERAPYNERPAADTTNARDFIFTSSEREGGGIVLGANADGEAIAAALLIAVDRSGAAARKAEGWGGWLRGLVGW